LHNHDIYLRQNVDLNKNNEKPS